MFVIHYRLFPIRILLPVLKQGCFCHKLCNDLRILALEINVGRLVCQLHTGGLVSLKGVGVGGATSTKPVFANN